MATEFEAALMHDLRAPSATIRMAAEQLLDHVADSPREIEKKLCEIVVNGCDSMDRMTSGFLNRAEIDFGDRFPLTLTPVDLPALVRETARAIAGLENDRVVITGEAALGTWDADLLQRVLANLIDNARKYGRTDAPITVHIARSPLHTTFSIHNEGAGISSADQVGLFEPFYRTTDTIAEGKPGWGLGLPTVRKIAEAHGGCISVSSEPSRGTVFTIFLPNDVSPYVPRPSEVHP